MRAQLRCARRRLPRPLVLALAALLLVAGCSVREPRGVDAPAPLAAASAAPSYPATRTSDVVDDYHGTPVADPYRWMETLSSPEVREWAAAQDALATSVLGSDPLRDWLLQRSRELDAPWGLIEASRPPKRAGKLAFALAPVEEGGPPALTVQRGSEAPRVLVDPGTLEPDVAIVGFHPAPDERHVAYALSRAGSEWTQLRIRRVADGQDLPETLDDMLWVSPQWTRDGEGFFYVRSRPGAAGSNTMFHSPAVLYHRLATPPEADTLIHATPEGTTALAVLARLTPDRRHLLFGEGEGAYVEGLGWSNSRWWLLDLGAASAPDIEGTPVALTPDRHSATWLVGQDGSRLYVFTDRDAPRRRLVAVNVDDPASDRWQDVIPEQPEVLDRVAEVNGHWVATYLDDVQHRVRVFDRQGRLLRELQVPPLASVHEIRPGPDATQLDLLTSSALRPPTLTRHDIRTGELQAVQAVEPPFDAAAFEAHKVWYTSRDGTRIPMFLLHRRGLVRDGSHPVLMHGYGASSQVTQAGYTGLGIAWAELGGIVALPVLRGGGEFGRGWYEAATLERKQASFDDFIAAAEWLVAEGYTSPARLAISGASNGGLLVAATVAQRPDLFGAALAEVPQVDVLRSDPGRHRAQFGYARDPAQFPFLHAYAPLQRIEEGRCYPATLITTAMNDERAPAWHAFKLAATLQAAQACSKPVLLRVHDSGGHLAARGPDAWREDVAEAMAFAARQLGMQWTTPVAP